MGRTLLIQVLLILKYACRGGMGCLIFQRCWSEGPSEVPAVNVVFRLGYRCMLPERTFGCTAVPATWPSHARRSTEGWGFIRNTLGVAELGRADSASHAPAAVDGDARRFWSAAYSVEACFRMDRCFWASAVRHETSATATSCTSTHQRRQCGLPQTLQPCRIVLVSPRRLTDSGPEQPLPRQFRICRRLRRLSGIRFALLRWTTCMAEGDRCLPQDFRYLWLRLTTTFTTSMT